MTPQAATLIPQTVSQRMPTVQTEASALINMIERATRDPSVDIEKMERLLAMHERLLDRDAETAFNEAMRAAQAEMEPVRANANNPQTRSKYATYQAIDDALRPVYNKHGFSISYDTGDGAPENHIRVLAYVSRGRFTRTYKRDMPADGKGAKGNDVMTKTHAAGSAETYGRRYLIGGIFNVVVTTDDDGNSAGGRSVSGGDTSTINDEQIDQLQKAIVKAGADIAKFCAIFKIEAVADLPAKRFQEAMTRLGRFAQQHGGAK